MPTRNPDILPKNYSIKYFWIFVTERCNLKCTYCFYKFRDNPRTISPKTVSQLISFLPRLKQSQCVLSGGEPFLEWKTTKQICEILLRSSSRSIVIQSNGTLWTRDILKYLKNLDIGLEIGLDGTFIFSNIARNGLIKYSSHVRKNIDLALKYCVRLSATMSITPQGASRMNKNYAFLRKLGIPKIEVTPVAFEKWTKKSSDCFRAQYSVLLRDALEHKQIQGLSMDYDSPLEQPCLDLILLPDGNALSNWAMLSLPNHLKQDQSWISMNNGKPKHNPDFWIKWSKIYTKLYKDGNATYRDFSNLHAKAGYQILFRNKGAAFYRSYEALGNFLKTMHKKILILRRRYDQVGK
jgi:hypothetical protein